MKESKAPCRHGKPRTRGCTAAAQYGYLRAIAINFGRVYRHLRRHSLSLGGSLRPRAACRPSVGRSPRPPLFCGDSDPPSTVWDGSLAGVQVPCSLQSDFAT
jgi:hypothetical protein